MICWGTRSYCYYSSMRRTGSSRVNEDRNIACFAGYRVELRVTVEVGENENTHLVPLTETAVRVTCRMFNNANMLEVPH